MEPREWYRRILDASPASQLRCSALIVGFLVCVGIPGHTCAAGPTPELQRQARAATFELVVPKGSESGVTYSMPLPTELVPFVERNDRYWSIGSAFAVGPNEFVTAGHLLAAVVGRQGGRPALRDSRGRVHAIDRILKYSMPEDFAVFSVQSAPDDLRPFAPSESALVDDTVFAVGNALGEGIVIRDGLLTSRTPEARAGRWDWLRFSAATSPGNSGGPLLDAQGRVIGVVTAKSPGENLNFALPIERVAAGSRETAVLEAYAPFGLLILQDPVLVDFRADFPLPADFEEFSRRFLQVSTDYYVTAESRLLAERADHLFPKGDRDEFLAETYRRLEPTLLAQQADRRWGLLDTSADTERTLAGNGRVWSTTDPRLTLFRIEYPTDATDVEAAGGSKAFMDWLLQGLRLQRYVGPQAVQITSLGAAASSETIRDRHRRAWRLQRWPVSFSDAHVIVLSMATPDGRVGMALQSDPKQLQPSLLQLRTLADYFFVSYTGSLRQWQAFLERRDQTADVFGSIRVSRDKTGALAFESPLFDVTLPATVLRVEDGSRLDLWMSYLKRGEGTEWLPVGVTVRTDETPSASLKIMRQAQPAAGVPRRLINRWEQMSGRREDFSGQVRRDAARNEFWFRSVATPGTGDGRVLYEVTYTMRELLMPRDLEARRDEVMRRIVIKEPQ